MIPKSREKEFSERFEEYARTLDCVHCGLCIPHCPTQGITGRESDSPRGRIYLMRGYAEKTMPFTRASLQHLDECIVCRNCETVCPSGIRMGEMMESFRHEMNRVLPGKGWRFHVTRVLLDTLVPHRSRLATLTDLLYLYERSGLRRLGQAAGRLLGRLGWRRAAQLDRLLPPIPPPRQRRIAPTLYPALGEARMRVALFLGCITSELFAPTHRATIRMLNRAGCDVVVPEAQTCCGALHRHSGLLEPADSLFEKNHEVFSATRADVLIVNAAGCGAALREPPSSCPDGVGLPVRDVCEFLDEIGIPEPTRPYPRKVAYDQPCHLVHGQRVPAAAVENLLCQIPDLELVPLDDSERCCGSGGIYNILHPDLAGAILDEKVDAILRSGAEVVATGNPGCWLQIRAGLAGRPIDVRHPIDLLDAAYSAAESVGAVSRGASSESG